MSPVTSSKRERMLVQLERLPASDRKAIMKFLGKGERLLLEKALREWSKARRKRTGSGAARAASKPTASPYSPWMAKHILSVASGEDIKGSRNMTPDARLLLLIASAEVSGQSDEAGAHRERGSRSGAKPDNLRAGGI